MSEIALIAVDLDGTLITSERTLAAEGARLLKQARRGGKRIILATIRNANSVRALCQQLELDEPIICANGAHILQTPDGPDWHYATIPQHAAQRIAQLADEQDWELSTTIDATTYWRQRPGQTLGQLKANTTIVATNREAIVGNPIRIIVGQPEASEGLTAFCRTELPGLCQTEVFINPAGAFHSMAICPANVDKGKALEVVLHRLHLTKEQAMAIGDNFVDIPMFRAVGVSVAMGNAPEQVKQAATVVAPSNDEEGVAWALKTYKIV